MWRKAKGMKAIAQEPDHPTTEAAARSTRPVAFSVAHAIPGRVRFHVPRIAADSHYARRLAVLAESDAYVTSVRVNSAAASLVINYRGGVMADAAMHAHLDRIILATRDVVLPAADAKSSVVLQRLL